MTSEMRHLKRVERKKNRPFKVFMGIWILLLVGVGIYCTQYVKATLKEMQANVPAEMVQRTVSSLSDDKIKELFIFNENVNEGDKVRNIRDYLKSDTLEIKQMSGKDSYGIFVENKHVLTVNLKKLQNVSKVGIFNYGIYEVEGVEAGSVRELYRCSIVAPSELTVYMGGNELTPVREDKLDGFADASKYVELPSVKYYELDHLTKAPDLKIMKGNEEVAFEPSEKIVLYTGYEKFDSLKAAGCNFDALAFAEDWSRFMTKDLAGTGRYGFNSIAKYFIKDSTQYKSAWEYVSVVDITFISPHTLRSPAFTDKKASNVIKYSDNVMSVDVHLVKHMRLDTGASRDDTLNNTLYLVKYKGEWKVINMRQVI